MSDIKKVVLIPVTLTDNKRETIERMLNMQRTEMEKIFAEINLKIARLQDNAE